MKWLAAALCLVAACATGPSARIEASARALALQPDGKIVLAGTAGTGNRIAFALARYLPDGGLDPGFGAGGKVVTRFKDSPSYAKTFAGAYARGVAVQPDGRILAGGLASIGGLASVRHDYALARYHADGSPDRALGFEGTVTTQVDQTMYNIPAFALQPDGKPLLGGDARSGGVVFVVIRYLPDGSLDPAFGSAGKVTTSFGPSWAFVRAIAVQPDGRLVAAGFVAVRGEDHFGLARYLPDGSLDPAFGNGGTVTTPVSFGAKGPVTPGFAGRGAFAVALQPDGKIVVAGASEALKGRPVFGLARFLPDGTLDRAFGAGGTVTTDFGDGSAAYALALQPDGKIVVAGQTGRGESGADKFALARYLPNGTLDSSFGVNGRLVGDFASRGAQAIAAQPDGKLLASGLIDLGDRSAFVLLRYLPDGSSDPNFGAGGRAITEF